MFTSGAIRELGSDPERAVLRFGEEPNPSPARVAQRVLLVDGQPAFELSYWCGTCPMLFKRREGAHKTLSVANLAEQHDIDRLTTIRADLPRPRSAPHHHRSGFADPGGR
ncbi:hypothetical protein GCM10023319_82510 [Nocardia iowensis]